MNIFQALEQLQENEIVCGKPLPKYALRKLFIRWYDGNLNFCEKDGTPSGYFNLGDFFNMYDWEVTDLPEYTNANFDKAYRWLLKEKSIKLISESKEYIFSYEKECIQCSVPNYTLSWKEIIHGEWFIKN